MELGSDHVRDVDRISSILLRDSTGNLQEGYELEDYVGISSISSNIRESHTNHPKVKYLHSSDCSVTVGGDVQVLQRERGESWLCV